MLLLNNLKLTQKEKVQIQICKDFSEHETASSTHDLVH